MEGFERETSIWYNEADKGAMVGTYNRGLISRLDKLLGKECVFVKGNEDGYRRYTLPKSWVAVRPPKKMNYTDEQRAEIAERFAATRRQQDADD